MNNIYEEIEKIREEVSKSTAFLSDDENFQYEVNKSSKIKLMDIIYIIHSEFQNGGVEHNEYEDAVAKLMNILSENTGCAEDLEIFDFILDKMIFDGVVNEDVCEAFYKKSPVNRWGLI